MGAVESLNQGKTMLQRLEIEYRGVEENRKDIVTRA